MIFNLCTVYRKSDFIKIGYQTINKLVDKVSENNVQVQCSICALCCRLQLVDHMPLLTFTESIDGIKFSNRVKNCPYLEYNRSSLTYKIVRAQSLKLPGRQPVKNSHSDNIQAENKTFNHLQSKYCRKYLICETIAHKYCNYIQNRTPWIIIYTYECINSLNYSA